MRLEVVARGGEPSARRSSCGPRVSATRGRESHLGHIQDAFAASKGPLVSTLKMLAAGGSAAGAEAIDALRSFFGSKGDRS